MLARDLIKTSYPSDGLSDDITVIADVGVKLNSHPIKKCFSYITLSSRVFVAGHQPRYIIIRIWSLNLRQNVTSFHS